MKILDRFKIKKIYSPDYDRQVVLVEFENGEIKKYEAHSNPSHSYYILVDGVRLNFYDLGHHGEWLDQMLS